MDLYSSVMGARAGISAKKGWGFKGAHRLPAGDCTVLPWALTIWAFMCSSIQQALSSHHMPALCWVLNIIRGQSSESKAGRWKFVWVSPWLATGWILPMDTFYVDCTVAEKLGRFFLKTDFWLLSFLYSGTSLVIQWLRLCSQC